MSVEVKVARSKELKPQSTNLSAALIEGNQRAVAHWMEVLLALTQEITTFTQHRFQEDIGGFIALASCRNAAQAFEHQQRFIAKASQEYADEVAKLGRMVTSLGWEGISDVYQPPKGTA